MRRIPVSDIEQRIKHAVAEQLGSRAEEIKNEASFMGKGEGYVPHGVLSSK